MTQLITNRLAFVEAHPHLRPAHRVAQSALFATAHAFGLKSKTTEERATMIGGINEFLTLAISSRRELTVREMEALVVAIEAGAFRDDWQLTGEVIAEFDGEGGIDLLAGDGQPPRILCRVCRERAQFYALCDDNGDDARGPGFCRECAPRPRENFAGQKAQQQENYVLRLVLEDEHLDACERELDALSFRHSVEIQQVRAEICAQRESLHIHMDTLAGQGEF